MEGTPLTICVQICPVQRQSDPPNDQAQGQILAAQPKQNRGKSTAFLVCPTVQGIPTLPVRIMLIVAP